MMSSTTRIRTFLAMLTALFLVGAAGSAFASIERYEVRVSGLACPFCAFGLEKKLKALPGVSKVEVNLEGGRASFEVNGDAVVMPNRVEAAVTDAGFTPREITVRASGAAQGEGDDLRLGVGDGHELELRGGDAFARLRALVEGGQRSVIVTGRITRSGDAWRLRVDQAEPRGS